MVMAACNSSGEARPVGPQGTAGPAGATGLTGIAGPPGLHGPQGDAGIEGVSCWDLNSSRTCEVASEDSNFDGLCTALDCVTGVVGAQGPIGPAGPRGDTGAKGDKGERGETGGVGPKGDMGATGLPGLNGAKGDKGDAGAPGAQGPKGDRGDTGAQGSMGIQGPIGQTGSPGPTSIAKCPDGMKQIETGHSVLCYAAAKNQGYLENDAYCYETFRAPLCTYQQWRAAICRAAVAQVTPSWVNGVGGNQVFAGTRACSIEGPFVANGAAKLDGHCCLEWMNY